MIPSPRALWRRLHLRFDLLSSEVAALNERLEHIEGLLGHAGGIPETRDSLLDIQRRLDVIEQRTLARMQRALGRVEGRQLVDAPFGDSAFQVYSQDGEDGMLLWLSRLVPLELRSFVEFGVETYVEANSRFLLADHGWQGTVFDCDESSIRALRASAVFTCNHLEAEHELITAENVNDVMRRHGLTGDTGLLSVDIDGNDWWVWEALDAISPLIVAIEYNAFLGPDRSVTIPYRPDFDRRQAHPSWMYFGASLAALERLGTRKGYSLVGVSPSGVNAFFVRTDILPGSLPPRSARDVWRPCRFADFRDGEGCVVRRSPTEIADLLLALPLVDID